MADEKQAEEQAKPAVEDPFGDNMGPSMADLAAEPPDPDAAKHRQIARQTVGNVVTAQKVDVPRDERKIVQKMKVLCGINGMRYVYSWPVKDRQNQRETTVEGGTVKLANDLARTYGNCWVGIEEVHDTDTHWMFKATFIDLETGFSYSRPFAQNKEKNVGGGMRDATRREDMVFQIGASKAIRNVVLNALSAHADFCVEEAKTAMVNWIQVEGNAEKAAAYVDRVAEKYQIDLSRVDAVIGRKREDWTMKDLVRVVMEFRGIEEGLSSADDLYPDPDAAKAVMERKMADKQDKAPAAETVDAKPAKKGGAKKTTKKKAEKKDEAAEASAGEKDVELPEPEPGNPEPEDSGSGSGGVFGDDD